jgi:hypothetical protein
VTSADRGTAAGAAAEPSAGAGPAEGTAGKGGLFRLLRNLAPVAISVVALYLVYRRVPLADVGRALELAELRWFLPLMLVYFLGVLCSDSWALMQTLRLTLCRASFREIISIRAATYLLSLFNYHLGQGGLALYLSRKKDVTLAAAAGSILFMMGINLLMVMGVSAVGTFAAGAPLPRTVSLLVAATMLALPVYLLMIALPTLPGVSRLRQTTLFAPLFRAGLRGHALAALVRLPHVCVMVVGHYLALRCFHVEVPVRDALAVLPLILLVGALPIAIQGLGPVQMASIVLLARFSTAATPAMREAAVVAESLSLSSIFLLLQLLTGLLFLPRAMRDLGGPGAARPPA